MAYPREPETIVLQMGWTQNNQIGEVWEEMNGTPWFTLYGDGRVIAGHELLGRDHALYQGRVTESDIQGWLRRLTYDIGFFSLRERYEHPYRPKPSMHVYVNTRGGSHRVTLAGFESWEERDVESEPDRHRVKQLVTLLRAIESFSAAGIDTEYEAERYTILAQMVQFGNLADPPAWSGGVNVWGIATAAPTAASNYVDKVVGHRFVDAPLGKEVREIVWPLADQWFPFWNRAMEFKVAGRTHAVGARQEVPGGSPFLPDGDRQFWYRVDPGSGTPPLSVRPAAELSALRRALFEPRRHLWRRE